MIASQAAEASGAAKRRAGGEAELRQGLLMDELLAHIAERETGSLKAMAMEVVGAVRAWLREHGFARLASMGMSDISHVLRRGRLAVEGAVSVAGWATPRRKKAQATGHPAVPTSCANAWAGRLAS